jgi:hypothetical protein
MPRRAIQLSVHEFLSGLSLVLKAEYVIPLYNSIQYGLDMNVKVSSFVFFKFRSGTSSTAALAEPESCAIWIKFLVMLAEISPCCAV